MDPQVAISPQQRAAVEKVFHENFETRGELGASVAVYQDGECQLSLGKGSCDKAGERSWTTETLVPIYSATKGPAAATVLLVLDRAGLQPNGVVAEVWPTFPVRQATFAQVLSHQCGLSGLDKRVDVADYAAVIAAIEAQDPAWPLGDGHGYHPRTFGFLVDEIVRRVDGRSLADVWENDVRRPAGWDLFIGLPEAESHRVATLYPGKMTTTPESEQSFYKEYGTRGTITQKAFASPSGLNSVAEMNTPRAWQMGLPAMGGVASADGLAKFYQQFVSGGAAQSAFSARVRGWIGSRQTNGWDRVLQRETSFACGVMLDPIDSVSGQKRRSIFGPSLDAFGHPGAGGSHAFVDPSRRLSFAYTMNQMELSAMPGERCLAMVRALYS